MIVSRWFPSECFSHQTSESDLYRKSKNNFNGLTWRWRRSRNNNVDLRWTWLNLKCLLNTASCASDNLVGCSMSNDCCDSGCGHQYIDSMAPKGKLRVQMMRWLVIFLDLCTLTGKTDDAKASEKGKVPSKSSSGIQRSPSDAGRSSGDEGKKPPSGITRPPTTGSFGYKKIQGATGTLITSSGAILASGSATLGKAPKSSAAISKGASISGVRKTSLDGSQPQDDGILLSCSGSKVTLQYRSLPRPAKSSSGVAAGRSGHRSSSSSIDSNVSGKSAGGATTQTGTKRRDGKVGSERSSPITINQTDKEKVAVSDQDPAAGLSTSPKSSPTSTSTGQSGLRQPGSKYPDIASPTFRRSDTPYAHTALILSLSLTLCFCVNPAFHHISFSIPWLLVKSSIFYSKDIWGSFFWKTESFHHIFSRI